MSWLSPLSTWLSSLIQESGQARPVATHAYITRFTGFVEQEAVKSVYFRNIQASKGIIPTVRSRGGIFACDFDNDHLLSAIFAEWKSLSLRSRAWLAVLQATRDHFALMKAGALPQSVTPVWLTVNDEVALRDQMEEVLHAAIHSANSSGYHAFCKAHFVTPAFGPRDLRQDAVGMYFSHSPWDLTPEEQVYIEQLGERQRRAAYETLGMRGVHLLSKNTSGQARPHTDPTRAQTSAHSMTNDSKATDRQHSEEDPSIRVSAAEHRSGTAIAPSITDINAKVAAMPVSTPTCFISYSWDSDAHTAWVRSLAEDLQRSGILVTLDQWFVRPGTDLLQFMEGAATRHDYVVIVCTPDYARKSNAASGGVGFEKRVISPQVLAGNESEWLIPLLRSGDQSSIPTYLAHKLYVDFREDQQYPTGLEELLRAMHQRPRFTPPQLGPPPEL